MDCYRTVLTTQKLVKGSLVLGQVTRINGLDLEVSLPNNLTGRVSITAVSEQLSSRLTDAVAAAAEDDDDSTDESDVDLNSLFVVGQYLRTYVLSTMDESIVGKSKKRIDLSLRPSETNSGLDKTDVVSNSTLMASVVSVEDRGCVMDVGIPELRAFLPNGEIEKSVPQTRLQEGAVFLCHVTGKGSNGNMAQLSLKQERLGSIKNVPSDATTINAFLPGTAVNVLISSVDQRGLAGKVIGHLDVTADLVHSGAGPDGLDLEEKYKIGSKVKARVICNFVTAKEPKLGISLLPHITSLSRKFPETDKHNLPTTVVPISSLVEKCTVINVETKIGLFVDVGVAGLRGFVHISRVKDGKVDALYVASGPHKVGSVHKGRVVGYSELDGLFHVSFEKSVLDQPYLRLEDVPVGTVVTCEIEELLVNEAGVRGVVLKVADGITGLVREEHLADIKLQHPEKKFSKGKKVKARVLSTNPSKRQLLLTMKKALVNSDAPVIKTYENVATGQQAVATIIKLQPKGALVQFYGSVKGWLPVSEMSEAYIRDPAEHFRVGQVVTVHVLDVDQERRRLTVSCKDPGAFGLDKQLALKNLKIGETVSAKVTQKTEDQVFVELAGSKLKAVLPVGHLSDKSLSKNLYALKGISAGQTLSNLVVIDKVERHRAITLTQKPTLVAAAASGKLMSEFDQIGEGDVLAGFVRNVTPTAVFVQFGGSLQALLSKSRLSAEVQQQPKFGMYKDQSLEVRVVTVIPDMKRFMVAPVGEEQPQQNKSQKSAPPADGLAFGIIVEARVTSVKETQLNVQLVDSKVQGRIDVSEVFDKWEEIADTKKPLAKFHRNQQIRVKVLGVHDAKDHRFLPLSHRSAHSVLELTAKPSDVGGSPKPLTLESLNVGESHVAYVNNVTAQFLWVNLSPSVRGRVSAMDASGDLTLLNDLEENFPVGSALKVKVTGVDAQNNRLDLSARNSSEKSGVDWNSLRPNMVLPGRITKISERQIMIKLSETVAGPVHLPDMSDNYGDINNLHYKKHEIIRVAVVEVDASKKRLRLSMRPSRIMSSTLPVQDKEITSLSQISAGDIVRGFVRNITDKGLFVSLGGNVSAMIKIANLSDRYIKEWKDEFREDELVKGRVLSVDTAVGQVEMSLKSSVVDEDYTPLLSYKDISEGQVVTGKVRKVEEFGAFILVDNSSNVSGLCHRSQMADKPVKDATKLYQEGDAVKALVLDVDVEKRRITFGLKPSLFDDDTDMESDAGVALDEDEEMGEQELIQKLLGDNDEEDEEEDEEDEDEDEDGDEDEEEDEDSEMEDAPTGLAVGKKSAWSVDPFGDSGSESEDETTEKVDKMKKKKKRSDIQVDRTAELDAHGPQTSSDYERLLMGQPDSSELWIAYMAFQMQVSELSKAREVAKRAIKSINIREEAEKLNVWVAYLNLEVAYGTKATVEEVFKEACRVNDEQEVHERLASIYIQSEKFKVSRTQDQVEGHS